MVALWWPTGRRMRWLRHEASLVYVGSSKTARAVQKDHSKNETKPNKPGLTCRREHIPCEPCFRVYMRTCVYNYSYTRACIHPGTPVAHRRGKHAPNLNVYVVHNTKKKGQWEDINSLFSMIKPSFSTKAKGFVCTAKSLQLISTVPTLSQDVSGWHGGIGSTDCAGCRLRTKATMDLLAAIQTSFARNTSDS